MMASASRTFYLCPPDYLELAYEINPWMKLGSPFSREKARKEWDALVATYDELIPGRFEVLPAAPGLTELCFWGDSVFAYRGKAVYSRFRVDERAKETEYVMEVMEKKGFTGRRVPEGVAYEGSGETMLWNGKILFGHGPRSSREAALFLGEQFGLEVVALELTDPWFFHLDTALLPLGHDLIAAYMDAFSPASQKLLRDLPAEIVEISREEANRFALNAVVLDNTIVLPEGAEGFGAMMKERGFAPRAVPMGEFIKFGGGPKCLTFQHYE